MDRRSQMLWQIVAGVLCAAVSWRYRADLWGTEFEGGRVTGDLLGFTVVGHLLLLLGIPLTLLFRRIAAAIILLGSVLLLPLYLYFTAPGPFRRVVDGQWEVPLSANFAWDLWSFGGIATVALAIYICFLGLRSSGRPSDNQIIFWRGSGRYIRALAVSLLGFVVLNACYALLAPFPKCNDCHVHVGVPFAYRDVGGFEGGGGWLWRGVFADSVTVLVTALVLVLAVQHVLSHERS